MNKKKLIDGLKRMRIGLFNAKIDKEPIRPYLDAAITALEAQQADRWIPVTNGSIPEVNDGDWAVFVIPGMFNAGTTRITARYFKEHGIKHEDGWTDNRVKKATHWMPLSELWKEEQPCYE